jgi:ferredoxin
VIVGDIDERQVGDLKVQIDRTLCVGFGDCVKAAPQAFALDSETLAVFVSPDQVSRETLLEACGACPVDAITVWDAEGRQIVP